LTNHFLSFKKQVMITGKIIYYRLETAFNYAAKPAVITPSATSFSDGFMKGIEDILAGKEITDQKQVQPILDVLNSDFVTTQKLSGSDEKTLNANATYTFTINPDGLKAIHNSDEDRSNVASQFFGSFTESFNVDFDFSGNVISTTIDNQHVVEKLGKENFQAALTYYYQTVIDLKSVSENLSLDVMSNTALQN
jgi:hypothetical protein